jgi:hypothetical protein
VRAIGGGGGEGDKTPKGELVAVWADDGACFNHSGNPSLGRAVDALKSPREEGRLVGGRTPRREGQGAKEVEGSGADTTADLNAEGEERVVLGCGGRKPAVILQAGTKVVGMSWGLSALPAITREGDVVRSAVNNDGMARIGVENDVWSFVGQGHERAGFVKGGNVAGLACTVERSNDWVMPHSGTVATSSCSTPDCVVTVEVNFADGKGAVAVSE